MKTSSLKKILLPVAGLLLLAVSILAVHYLFAGIGIGLAGTLIFGPNVEVLRGKTGGIVYVNGKTGPYTRARVKPRNPKTNSQVAIREQMRGYAKLWKTSGVNQTAFNDYALTHAVQNHMGKSTHISGFNWFVKFNRIAQMASTGVTLISTPPTADTLFPILMGLTLVTQTGPDLVTVQPNEIGTYPTGIMLEVTASPQFSAGVFSAHGFRGIGTFDPTTTPAIDVTAAYEAKYTTLQNGQKIFFKARLIMPTGESNLWVSQNSVVVPKPT